MSNKNMLVAFFSFSGTTRYVARTLADAIGADIFDIQPTMPYLTDDLNWTDKNCRSSQEMRDPSARPGIAGRVTNMENYHIVFVGFPIWWGMAPRIVQTFLESYDFTGKTIIPFATSDGSGIDGAMEGLRASGQSAADWKLGKLWNGTVSNESIHAWISDLDLSLT